MYPKVLVISGSDFLTVENQSSITLKSLFEIWPKHKLSLIVCGDFNVNRKNEDKIEKFYLSVKDISILKHIFKETRVPTAEGDNLIPVIPNESSLIFKIKRTFKLFLTDTLSLFPYESSNKLLNFINAVQPDVIYSTVENLRIITILMEIHRKFKIPFVPHFYDDFPKILFSSPFSIFYRLYFNNAVARLISQSKSCLCIGEAMCMEFSNRYNQFNFLPLMNSVEKYYGEEEPNNFINLDRKLRFCYTGGLHLKRADVIVSICKSFDYFLKNEIELYIYSSHKDWDFHKDKFSSFNFIHYRGTYKKDDFFKFTSQSDVLLHVESFDFSIRNYTRFSISTKLPEYLSTGKLILAIGPSDIASMMYLIENKAALIINDVNNLNLINEVLQYLYYGNISDVRFNAQSLFFRNHLRQDNIETLMKALS